ncbi:dihydroneopterin aldolase [Amphibacillus marinus]|uniref:7,8-dihydroneopterin aldolase n=1 Tax=Amphibacillus marinus TaxID=872970 RepID=A0A1H8TK50_9BACI|nr:dihydroneopterin aldolase [Amphibacillus marinus]SEO91201.1 dihydroneopterin aldolase [Amphibacillus marinus]
MDKILLNGLTFYGYHGALHQENELGQRFVIDLELELPLEAAGKNDDLVSSIDYGEVYNLTKAIVEGAPYKLIEAVAEKIVSTLFSAFTKLVSCRVKVIKPDPPIPGHYQSVAVEIYRDRNRNE